MALASISLKGRALRALAQREFTRAELQAKLAPYEAHEGQLQALLDELQAKGLQDDARAMQSILHRRAAKLGTRRVLSELRSKGVEADLLPEAAEALRATELQRAHLVWQRRFQTPPADATDHARQMRFLLARGFDASVVRRVLGGLPEDNHDGL